MLIENKGIRTDSFYIPPFELNEGEIIVLNLLGGQHFYETEMYLKDIFCGKSKNEDVLVHKRLAFVAHFLEPQFSRLFYPMTVGRYLKKNANFDSPFATKIYETDWIKERTKVNTLAGNPRKLLSLYATLSNTDCTVFDVVGQGLQGARDTYKIVKNVVKNGGSAILLDCFGDFKNDCTKYIELQWTKNNDI